MKTVFNSNSQAGSQNYTEPRHIGGIISGILRSNSPFGKAYRKHLAVIKKGGSVAYVYSNL